MHDEEVVFKVFEALKHLMGNEKCMRIDVIDPLIKETFKQKVMSCSFEAILVNSTILEAKHEEGNPPIVERVKFLGALPLITHAKGMKKILMAKEVMKEDPQKFELKLSTLTFESAFLEGMVCPILDNSWVSLVQVIPKKDAITVAPILDQLSTQCSNFGEAMPHQYLSIQIQLLRHWRNYKRMMVKKLRIIDEKD